MFRPTEKVLPRKRDGRWPESNYETKASHTRLVLGKVEVLSAIYRIAVSHLFFNNFNPNALSL